MTDVIDLTVPEQAHFTVPGNPVSQPRSRFYNGGVANIRSKERKNFIEVVKHQMAVNPGNHWLPISIGVPVQLRVEFYVKTPAGSQTKSKKTKCHVHPGPDLDNLAKFVMDALNGIAYDDDRQITTLLASKSYDRNDDKQGRTEIFVSVDSNQLQL